MSTAIRNLLLQMADDALVLGHRHSEWTGLGPILEEDIALSSMAQDKIGHAQALYAILSEQFGESDPDLLAFHRTEKDFRNCHLVEHPNGEYDFTTVRHFLFDQAESIRYEMLMVSTFQPLARLAKKIRGELKYHVLHAQTWFTRLGRGTEESNHRMQEALHFAYPLALGLFETGTGEEMLIADGVFAGELELQQRWEARIHPMITQAHLVVPGNYDSKAGFGGRSGKHTPYLQPLLLEMSEVMQMENHATW